MGIDNLLGRKEDVREILEKLGIKKEEKTIKYEKVKKPADSHLCQSSKMKPDYEYTPYSADCENFSMFSYAWNMGLLREEHSKGAWPNQPLFTADDGSKLVRPLSLKETIEARVNCFSGKGRDKRPKLFGHWFDSCTGVAYKSGSLRFKIIPICKEMIMIRENFEEQFIPVDYDKLEGIELTLDQHKYDQKLTKSEALNHPAWIAAVEEDTRLLKEYVEIVFNIQKEYSCNMKVSLGINDYLKADYLVPIVLSTFSPLSGLNSNMDSPSYGFKCGACFLRIKG